RPRPGKRGCGGILFIDREILCRAAAWEEEEPRAESKVDRYANVRKEDVASGGGITGGQARAGARRLRPVGRGGWACAGCSGSRGASGLNVSRATPGAERARPCPERAGPFDPPL